MIENLEYDKIAEFLYKSCQEIRSELFLQFICFFKIITYEELFVNVPYIKEISNFNSYPTFSFTTKKDILENARDVLSETNRAKVINKLTNDNKDLKIKINKLKEKIQNLHFENEMLNKKSDSIQQNFYSMVLKNQVCCQNNFTSEHDKMLNENFIISRETVSKYPLFECLYNKFISQQSDKKCLKFCLLMRLLNKNSYDYLCKMLPFYSVTSCKYFIRPLKKKLIDMIQTPDSFISILEIFYDEFIKFESHKTKEDIYITLGGDAASIKPVFQASNNAVYAFEVLPLSSDLPPCIVNMMQARNGPSSSSVVQRFQYIIDYLTKNKFIVKYIATDGDISFDSLHTEFFEQMIEPQLSKSFIDIVKSLVDINKLPVSDPFHLLKTAHARLINYLILIDADELKCVNTQLFAEAVDLGYVFTDKNSSSAMKDDYILALFSWHSLIEVMKQGRYDAAYYILPYVYFTEVIRSPLLSCKERIEFLQAAFEIFKHHYQELKKHSNSDLFMQRYQASCIGVFFFLLTIFFSNVL